MVAFEKKKKSTILTVIHFLPVRTLFSTISTHLEGNLTEKLFFILELYITMEEIFVRNAKTFNRETLCSGFLHLRAQVNTSEVNLNRNAFFF